MHEAGTDDTAVFETHRQELLGLAYRMLGEVARAEDVVQEAWVRWQGRTGVVDSPRAFLLTTVTRLCIDELTSARARHEENRGERLPEPIDLGESGVGLVETLDQVSMAFLVLLQRLTPAERAVLLLHDVFDLSHGEIGTLLGRSAEASRQLLSRARENVAAERRVFRTSREEHRRLLMTFVRAITGGDQEPLFDLLAEDVVLIADNPGKGYGRIRKLLRPVVGRTRVLALVKALASQNAPKRELVERDLNGQPAMLVVRDGRVVLAILVSVSDERIRHVFLQADSTRLRHVGPLN
jgi:RNA polymerase sigma-70 factor (ECF subfamily)